MILAVGVAFFIAELGDKTMLATIALATREDLLGVWLGSTAGMIAADALAIGIGRWLGTQVARAHRPDRRRGGVPGVRDRADRGGDHRLTPGPPAGADRTDFPDRSRTSRP